MHSALRFALCVFYYVGNIDFEIFLTLAILRFREFPALIPQSAWVLTLFLFYFFVFTSILLNGV